MEEVNIIYCKNCGEPLNLSNAKNNILKCKHCNTENVLPKDGTPEEAKLYIHDGQRALDTGNFDEASTCFDKAIEIEPTEPEAYFGKFLAKHKVQYLKDVVNNRLQPICYEISNKKFDDDKNYLKALELATKEQKENYLEKAKEIDYIRSEFDSLRKKGLDYDCFICVKVSEENGNKTSDYNDANELYFYLKEKGYSPFFSEREIKNGQIGADYEALILYALYTSECMLIVCNNEEYLETKWVKNEYTRFNNLIREEEKERNSITFVFRNNPIEKLPGKSGKIEGIDLSKPDAYGRIEEYISSFNKISIGNNLKIERKNYDSIKVKKQISQREGIKKRTLSIQKGGELSVSNNTKLTIVKDFMERKNFSSAIKTLNGILKENSLNGEAYFLKFLCENECSNIEKFINTDVRIKSFDNFEKALSLMELKKRNEMYDMLYKRIKKFQHLNEYDEYVTLPESDDKRISELTDHMFKKTYEFNFNTKYSKISIDTTVFDHIIKTVTDTQKYIEMNLKFAKMLHERDDLPYYKNVLSVDEGNHEALLNLFIAENGYKAKRIFNNCLGNTSQIEEKLFSYGFNGEACEYLFSLCIEFVRENVEGSCKLFDFLLTMIPEKFNDKFVKYIKLFIESLFKNKKLKYIPKYNDTLISIDKYDHEAYFNRVLLKYKYHNPLQLILLKEKLIDDEDYITAISSYSEKNPNKKNLYIDIYDTLHRYIKSHIPNKRNVLNNYYVSKNELLNLDIILSDVSKNKIILKEDKVNKNAKWVPCLYVLVILASLVVGHLFNFKSYILLIINTIAIVLFNLIFKKYENTRNLMIPKIFNFLIIIAIGVLSYMYLDRLFPLIQGRISRGDERTANFYLELFGIFRIYFIILLCLIYLLVLMIYRFGFFTLNIPLLISGFVLIFSIIMDFVGITAFTDELKAGHMPGNPIYYVLEFVGLIFIVLLPYAFYVGIFNLTGVSKIFKKIEKC